MGRDLERETQGIKVCEDATHQAFWERLAEELREAAMAGRAGDWVEDSGIEDGVEIDPEIERQMEAHDKAVEKHPLVGTAGAYMLKTAAWLKDADADLKRVGQELLQAAGNPFSEDDLEEQALSIGEMIEVVAWYHTLIPSKIGRAVGGLVESEDRDSLSARFRLEDANGTGKVVLAAIERSAAAWVTLRAILPQREDEIIEMLALLSQLQRGMHATFPGAKAFIRPGFDERLAGGGEGIGLQPCGD